MASLPYQQSHHLHPPTPTSMKPHPFQVMEEGSSELLRGAYGKVDTNEGVFMRIDFPGVNEQGLQVVFNDQRNELSIKGQVPTPHNWPEFKRFYTTKISFSHPISQTDVQYSLINGSLKIFFSNPGLETDVTMTKGVPCIISEDSSSEHSPELGFGTFDSRVQHRLGCRCCRRVRKVDCGEIQLTHDLVHINPFAIGWMGACLHKKVIKNGDRKWTLEVLMEAPGLTNYKFESSSKACILNGEFPDEPDHKLEVHGRSYFLSIKMNCSCCAFKSQKAKHWVRNGMFGLSIPISK